MDEKRAPKPLFTIAVIALAVLGLLVAAWRASDWSSDPAPADTGTPILEFEADEATERLVSDMRKGTLPLSCDVMYDQMGSRPLVTVTSPEQIREIYGRFSRIRVLGESQLSITDCYHHVGFTLADGTRLSWGFEGEGLLSRGYSNYDVSGGGELWAYVRALQDEQMGEDALP